MSKEAETGNFVDKCRAHFSRTIFFIALLGGTCVATGGEMTRASVGVSAESAAALQAVLDKTRNDGLPGGIIVRVQSLATGQTWEGASGPFAEEDALSAIRAADSFRVASITKTFTAVVVWRLAEDKKLGIDDKIGKYLDPEIVSHIDVLDGVSYGEQITIRQLLCHCSGLWDYAVENKNMMRYIFAHPNHQWEPSDLIDVVIKEGKPYFKPGEGYHYSDTGYILLGQIIEKVTGKPLTQVYRELIYQPLDLHDTFLEGREPALGQPRSHNYVGYLDETTFNPTMDAYASGGQVSTATDLAKFMSGLMQGRLFRDKGTLAAAMELPRLQRDADRSKLDAEDGWVPRHLFYATTRGGIHFIGHGGYWGGVMFYQPDRQLVITGTGNQVDRHLPLADLVRAFDAH
jgi:D-alanyl-D-alanine carboxypeptidase